MYDNSSISACYVLADQHLSLDQKTISSAMDLLFVRAVNL